MKKLFIILSIFIISILKINTSSAFYPTPINSDDLKIRIYNFEAYKDHLSNKQININLSIYSNIETMLFGTFKVSKINILTKMPDYSFYENCLLTRDPSKDNSNYFYTCNMPIQVEDYGLYAITPIVINNIYQNQTKLINITNNSISIEPINIDK